MPLTKTQREALKGRYGGFCAYCGALLGPRWHADHVQPLKRGSRWDHKLGKHVPTGVVSHPERDHPGNYKPACVPCNIHKSDLSLEYWRSLLEQSVDSMQRNYATFRHAHRFGLVTIQPARVVFYFERALHLERR